MSEAPLPKEWILTKLDDVVDSLVGGGTPSKSNPSYYSGNIPWMSVKDMNKHALIDTVDHITQEAVENSSTNIVPAGIPIIATRMSSGKVVTANFDSAINQDLKAVYLNANIETACFLHWYRSSARLIESLGTGTTVKGVRLEVLKGLGFPLPPLPEQKEIAVRLDDILAQVASIKTRLDALPAILKRFRQSTLAAAVSGKLTKSDGAFSVVQVDAPWAHEVVGLDHWEKFKFSEIVKIIGGSQPPKSEFRAESGDGYIRLIQIRDYKSDKHVVYIPVEKARRFCSKEDIMIGRYGPPIFQILRGIEGAYNVALMKAEPKDDKLDREYLFWFLKNYKLYNYIEAGSDRTAGQSGVNKKFLESYPILLPTIEEQTEIVRRVEELFAFADQVEQRVKDAQAHVNHLTQSILAKAFRGELTEEWRTNNPDLITGKNSAEALLARIKSERTNLTPKKKTLRRKGE